MNLISLVKVSVNRLPYLIRRIIMYIPFTVLVGRHYFYVRRHLSRYGPGLNRADILLRLNVAISQALQLPFYSSTQLLPLNQKSLSTLGDFDDIAVQTKKDLMLVTPKDRALTRRGRFLVNTGGTSGQPLAFFINRDSIALEWAHMHHIWAQLGYRRRDLKLTFSGKDIGSNALMYRPIHNEIIVNTYMAWDEVEPCLLKMLKRRDVYFLHGYPSILSDFAENLIQSKSPLLELINSNLKGVFLSSEFPAPHFREKIDSTFSAHSLSWYGHSEMGVLAYEKIGDPYRYHVMHTYGYAEAIPTNSDNFKLVCTSFANVVSPFIRYDTGDLINDLEYTNGVLSSFKISSGRVGDHVVDRAGHKISLTAMIHGRHHKAFAYVNHIQVLQANAGEVVLLITARESSDLSKDELLQMFDLSNIDMDFDLEVVDEPIRTITGKLPLLVSNRPSSN